MLNRSVIRRWSHVGRRLITLTKEIQAIKLVPKATAKPTAYGVTPIVENVVLRGPLGELAFPIHQGLLVKESPSDIEGERILRVELDNDLFPRLDKQERKFVRSMWGTTASLLRQNAHGVSEGYNVPIRLVGVGYKAFILDASIQLKVGHTHDINLSLPQGIKAHSPNSNKLLLSGCSLQQITQFAAKIRSFRPPEPYNGKGIFVGDETIKLKEGKKK